MSRAACVVARSSTTGGACWVNREIQRHCRPTRSVLEFASASSLARRVHAMPHKPRASQAHVRSIAAEQDPTRGRIPVVRPSSLA
eukprot:3224379-Pyramimonas_sp.AAC.1